MSAIDSGKNLFGRAPARIPALRSVFGHRYVEVLLCVAILSSIVVACASLLTDAPWLEDANTAFSALFAVELSLRFFTYGRRRTGRYLRDWWLDWVATVPWDLLLTTLLPGGGPAALRLLRLPRLARFLRIWNTRRFGIFDDLAYRLTRILERSILHQLFVLAVGSLAIMCVFALVFALFGAEFEHGNAFWFSLITLISSDSIFELQGQSTPVKGIVLVLAFIGIVIFNGILIAIVVNKLMERFEEIRQGLGPVRERGHLVLLGWSDGIPHLLDELAVFCRVEQQTLTVVILCDIPPESLAGALASRPGVTVIHRTGNPYNTQALERIAIRDARAAIMFGNDHHRLGARLDDALVIKTFVSFNAHLEESGPAHRPVAVLNFRDFSNSAYLEKFHGPGTVLFDPTYFSAKLIASMCDHRHAYTIYDELLSYAGNEFHFARCPELGGLPFGAILGRFPGGVPVGYIEDGHIRLVPPPDALLSADPELVLLAPDSTACACAPAQQNAPAFTGRAPAPVAEKVDKGTVALIGVNRKLPTIVDEIRRRNRHVLILDNQTEAAFRAWYADASDEALPPDATFRECHFRTREDLAAALPLDGIAKIVILADGDLTDDGDPDRIDADTFFRLLQIHHHIDRANGSAAAIDLVVEILNPDSELVVRKIPRCDHVVGPVLIGKLLMMFALEPRLEKVFRDLIRAGGIDLVSTRMEGVGGMAFGELLRRGATAPGRIPLGWIAEDGVVLNPAKDRAVPDDAEIILLVRESTTT